MSQPFKFKHLHEIVGVFVLGSIGTLLAVVLLIGRGQAWFEKRFTVIGFAAEQQPTGVIRRGMPVMISGTQAGEVVDASPEKKGLLVVMRVREAFRDKVTTTSKAVVQRPVAGLGQTSIKIQTGPSTIPLPDGGRIPLEKGEDLFEAVEKFFRDTESKLTPALEEAHELLRQSNILVRTINEDKISGRTRNLIDEHIRLMKQINDSGTVNRSLESAEKILQSAGRVAERIERGEGSLGSLLKDDALVRRAERSIALLEKNMDLLNQTLTRVNQASRNLPRIAAASATAAEDLAILARETKYLAPAIPGMMRDLDEVLFESRVLLEAAERHWLLRKYVQPIEYDMVMPTGILDAPGRQRIDAVKERLYRLSGEPSVRGSASPRGGDAQ